MIVFVFQYSFVLQVKKYRNPCVGILYFIVCFFRSDVNIVTKSNNSSEDVFHSVATRDKKMKDRIKLKPEVSVFITIVIMMTAFSVTLSKRL